MSEKVRLDTFDAGDFDKGAGKAKQALWFFVNALLVKASWNPFMGVKIALLRAFGAKIFSFTPLSSFDYRNAPIVVEDGAWIGAKALVCPGVVVGTHAVLAAGGVATKSLRPWTVYQGNPAKEIRVRFIRF